MVVGAIDDISVFVGGMLGDFEDNVVLDVVSGKFKGPPVGTVVTILGEYVGDSEGVAVGFTDGLTDGDLVGPLEGLPDGDIVGLLDGLKLGPFVGAKEVHVYHV